MTVFWRRRPLYDIGSLLFLALCGFGLLACSQPVAQAVSDAAVLCLQVLLPTLYPFFVLSSLLVGSGLPERIAPLLERWTRRLFSVSGSCGSAILLGMLCGYPVGARTVSELYRTGRCSRSDALNTLRFCNNAGPAFFIGAVGSGMLQDQNAGILLYGIHVIAALLIGIIFQTKKTSVKSEAFSTISAEQAPFPALFLQAVSGAFSSFLNVCSFVLLFAVLICLLQQLPLFSWLSPLPQALLCGSLELTSGAALAARVGLSKKLQLMVLSFLCGWGGWSVQLQTISFLQEAGLPCGQYLRAKLLHGLVSAGLILLLC